MIVTVHGERLDLGEARQADRFLSHFTSYQSAERVGFASEYLLAQRIVSAAIYDASHAGADDEQSDEDRFEAWADDQVEREQGDHA